MALPHDQKEEESQAARTDEIEDFDFEPATMETVTTLIQAAGSGQDEAWDRVYALLYRELHNAARIQIRRIWRKGDRSATSLINRTWLRLNRSDLSLKNREHMIALLSRAMRYTLLDEARRAGRDRRNEGDIGAASSAAEPSFQPRLEDLIDVERGIEALARIDPRLAQMVEMRYFADMSNPEIAEVMDITERTVNRDWRKARAFLLTYLGDLSDDFKRTLPPPA